MGELGGLLGSMAGKATDPTFWFYAPIALVLLWKRRYYWAAAVSLLAYLLSLLSVWSAYPSFLESAIWLNAKAFAGWIIVLLILVWFCRWVSTLNRAK